MIDTSIVDTHTWQSTVVDAGTFTVATTAIPDVYVLRSREFADERGAFRESFRADRLGDVIGRPVTFAQSNFSVSALGVVRGIHSAQVPPGQAKLVTCVRGSVVDFAVDLRIGSPTFGRHSMVVLHQDVGSSVYLGEGIGHAFVATSPGTCVNYLCSTTYRPDDVITVDALDPELALPLSFTDRPILSDTDRGAPSLAESIARGLLPQYTEKTTGGM